ncbi:SDR family NAD(P)-dependent oxidoreductase [Chloroflexota bacterium]
MGVLDLFSLQGKLALVSGCRKGIGKAMALALAEAGADVIGVSATLEPSGSEIEREVLALGRSFKADQCDFSDRQALYAFIGRVKAENPPLDILVNNAGTIRRNPALQHSNDDWDLVLEVDLTSHFIVSREFAKDMIDRGHGKIIFTASGLSVKGGITVPGYASAKGGIAQLTKALCNEWGSKGVNVNAVIPGYTATDMTEALRADISRYEAELARIPAGRWGVPDDLKGVVVFLASAASDYVHGALYAVDGGWLVR